LLCRSMTALSVLLVRTVHVCPVGLVMTHWLLQVAGVEVDAFEAAAASASSIRTRSSKVSHRPR
jgi:hypothetical protein